MLTLVCLVVILSVVGVLAVATLLLECVDSIEDGIDLRIGLSLGLTLVGAVRGVALWVVVVCSVLSI